MELSEKTQKLLAWTTHTRKSISIVKRLPFGTKPACSIFQEIIEKLLYFKVRGVKYSFDNIIVKWSGDKDYLNNLREVFSRL